MHRVWRAGVAAVLALGLAGCAPTGIDQAAAHEWLDRVSAPSGGADHWIGSASGLTGSDDNMVAANPDGVTLTFDVPRAVTAADVMCFGGLTASVDVQIEAQAFNRGVRAEIACDEQTHRIDLSDIGKMQGVSAVTFHIRTAAVTTYYADILS